MAGEGVVEAVMAESVVEQAGIRTEAGGLQAVVYDEYVAEDGVDQDVSSRVAVDKAVAETGDARDERTGFGFDSIEDNSVGGLERRMAVGGIESSGKVENLKGERVGLGFGVVNVVGTDVGN